MLAGIGIDRVNAQDDRATSQTVRTQATRVAQLHATVSREIRQARAAVPRAGGKPYYIEFRARNALSYGHTFAVIARVGEKLTKKNVHGLHPASESSVPWMIGHVIPVVSETGWSDGDIEDEYIIARYRIYLTAAEHKNLMAHVVKLKASSPVWHAVLYNCNAFVADIAKGMGLRTPSSTMLFPKEYITELKAVNAGRRPTLAASPASR
jgi:hypothetical protein